MSKLRIGVVVYPDNDPTDGGGFSYFNTLLNGINEFKFSPEIEIYNIIIYHGSTPDLGLTKPSLYIKAGFGDFLKKLIKKNTKKKANTTLKIRNPLFRYIYNLIISSRNKEVEKLLKKNKIDFVYYLKQQENILNYPFISTVWDVSHKSTNGFPEHSLNKNYEIREKYYLYTLNKSFLILCESEAGATELKQYYSFFPNKIKVLPLFASNIIYHQVSHNLEEQTLARLNLTKGKFFLYPAQFWPHKNHFNLIVAFHQLLQKNNDPELKLVLCGSDKGNYQYILDLINSLALTERVLVPGFVNDDLLYIFYKNATALTMPTFLGPTNIPVIEAAHLNCPVLCSNLAGHKEILGENALYFNPANADEITSAMLKILNNDFRSGLIHSAKDHISHSPFNINYSLKALDKILTDIIPVRKTWGVDYFLNIFLITSILFS